MRLILILFILLFAGAVAAVIYLPWWGSVLLFLSLILIGKLCVGRIVEALFKLPFKAKGAVLRAAKVEVHSIGPATKPVKERDSEGQEDPEGEEEDATLRYHCLDVTVTPTHTGGSFRGWGPCELQLVGMSATSEDIDTEDEKVCRIAKREVEDEGGKFVSDEGMKFEGPLRLRL
ncbi:MAG TPA: hypothetical protein VK968_12890, partial [Roseimicrobium sp.]|nr:hypothetical protein [Roseimicrobium sp.]